MYQLDGKADSSACPTSQQVETKLEAMDKKT
jgi:hypothetical protein